MLITNEDVATFNRVLRALHLKMKEMCYKGGGCKICSNVLCKFMPLIDTLDYVTIESEAMRMLDIQPDSSAEVTTRSEKAVKQLNGELKDMRAANKVVAEQLS